METKIYTKPNLVEIPLECVKWPRCVIPAVTRPEVAWTSIVSERTMISKSVVVHAARDKVWELLGDPRKIPVFDEGVIDVELLDENTMRVKDVYRAGDGPWKTQVFTEKILDREPSRLIKYEIEREGHYEQFTFTMEDGKEKGTSIVTLQFDGNFAVANPKDVENMMEKILMNIARVAIDKQTFERMVKAFKH